MNVLLNIFAILSRIAHAAPDLVSDAVKLYHAALTTPDPGADVHLKAAAAPALLSRIAEAAPELLDDARDVFHAALAAPVPPAPEPVPPAPQTAS